MKSDYAAIFDQRGSLYHQAMCDYPDARNEEFQTVVDLLSLQPHLVLVDVPSGGGYLQRFIDPTVDLISIEISSGFRSHPPATGIPHVLLAESANMLPVASTSVDRVLCLAALHHMADKVGFYREAFRILKPEGLLIAADVRAESDVALFLNTFVDSHNSMGHRGEFLDSNSADELRASGFDLVEDFRRKFCWNFSSLRDLALFCKYLFSLDKATPNTILRGVERYLGWTQCSDHVAMNWELECFRATKNKQFILADVSLK